MLRDPDGLGTATDAAAALGISQPAVSLAIASLEKELGFALFERVKGRLRPTRRRNSYSTTPRALSALSIARRRRRALSAITRTATS